MHSVGSVWLWSIFSVFVVIVFFVDIFLLKGGRSHRVSLRESIAWTVVWIVCALVFNLILWQSLIPIYGSEVANQKALEFFTGYLIEKSLSIDNMFVIMMIFTLFSVPAEFQRRVLIYGIVGAIVMRLIMILSGTWLIQQFHWMLYVFGVFLVFTGIKMLLLPENSKDLSQNSLIIWLRKHIRLTQEFHEEKFFIKQNSLWYATPLFLALVLVEFNDLIFALDSIPAIFAVTNDPFIVFSSNVFAILGLRALYFLLAHAAHKFDLLKYGIAAVLIFVGFKMLIAPWFKIPVLLALMIVAIILAVSMIASLVRKRA